MPRLSSFSDTKSGFGLSTGGDVNYAGYTMVFIQSTAPTGWTQITTSSYNNCTIRINSFTTPVANVSVNTSFFSFTSTFATRPVASGTTPAAMSSANVYLNSTHLPAHTHNSGGNDWLDSAIFTGAASEFGWPSYSNRQVSFQTSKQRSYISGNSSIDGASHGHLGGPAFTLNVVQSTPQYSNLTIAYINAILATKD